jgi:hypothetical protein
VAGSGEGGGSAGGWNTAAAADLNDGRNVTSHEQCLKIRPTKTGGSGF